MKWKRNIGKKYFLKSLIDCLPNRDGRSGVFSDTPPSERPDELVFLATGSKGIAPLGLFDKALQGSLLASQYLTSINLLDPFRNSFKT